MDEEASSMVPNVEEGNNNFLLDKYNRLNEQFLLLLRNNQHIESTLINLVEKSENDKALLSQEIDDLAARLQAANMTISQLQSDCARYKSDCVLAVHLLQCQPNSYVAHHSTNTLPLTADDLERNGIVSSENKRKPLIHVSSFSFPPTAVIFNDSNETYGHLANGASRSAGYIEGKTPEFHREGSLHELLVERIRSEPEYQTVQTVTVAQCSKCGRTVQKFDKQVQTDTLRRIPSPDNLVLNGRPYIANSMFTIGETAIKKSQQKRLDSGGSCTSTETSI